jgi:hypothetical protein
MVLHQNTLGPVGVNYLGFNIIQLLPLFQFT